MRILSLLAIIVAISLILVGITIVYVSETNKEKKPVSGLEIYKSKFEERAESVKEEESKTKHTVFFRGSYGNLVYKLSKCCEDN